MYILYNQLLLYIVRYVSSRAIFFAAKPSIINAVYICVCVYTRVRLFTMFVLTTSNHSLHIGITHAHTVYGAADIERSPRTGRSRFPQEKGTAHIIGTYIGIIYIIISKLSTVNTSFFGESVFAELCTTYLYIQSVSHISSNPFFFRFPLFKF